MATNRDKMAQIIGTSLATIILGSMAWKQLNPIAHELFKSEVEKYTEDVIRKHVTAFNDNTIDHHFKLPSQFNIEEIKCDPVEDTFGCFGEVQRILARVSFHPIAKKYYTPFDFKKIDFTSDYRMLLLPENEIPGLDTEQFRDKVFDFCNKNERIVLLQPLSADEIKECHTLIYNSLRNRQSENDAWHELKPYLTYGGQAANTYSIDCIKNKINYILYTHDKKLKEEERSWQTRYESYAEDFQKLIRRYQNAIFRILNYHEASQENSKLSFSKWDGYNYFVTISPYVGRFKFAMRDEDMYSDTEPARILNSAGNEYACHLTEMKATWEKCLNAYNDYNLRREKAKAALARYKGKNIAEEQKANLEIQFCTGAIKANFQRGSDEYDKQVKLFYKYKDAADNCYSADRLEVKKIATDLSALMSSFPRR